MRRRTAIAGVLAAGPVLAAATLAATRPDPLSHAAADGCERNPSGLYTGESPNWAYVNDRDAPAQGPPPPPQWVRGTASAQYGPWLAAHPAGGDNPFTHRSFDLITNIDADPAYEFLLGGDPARRTGNFEGSGEGTNRLHTEWETGAVARFAWPERGDRIEMLGSWVWDCDHFLGGGERTEFHPARALIVHRSPGRASPRSPFGETETAVFVSTDKTPAGTQADCAHRSKGDRARFKACVRSDTNWQDVNGEYRFVVRAPPRPSPAARLRVRLVDSGSSRHVPFSARRTGTRSLEYSFRLDVASGQRLVVAKQIFVGWTPTPARSLPQHLRVRFRRLIVRRAMDPGCPPGQPSCGTPQTTLTRQITAPPGEWNVYWNVAGIWGTWDPVVLRARDGQVFPGRQTVDLYVPRGRPWRLFMFARECDFGQVSAAGSVPMSPCPRSNEFGDAPGDETAGALERRFRSPAASLGRHLVDAKLDASTCPLSNRRGCYAVEFEVTPVRDEPVRASSMSRARRPVVSDGPAVEARRP